MKPDDVIDGKYAITRQLGRGGMGAVYEARHAGTGRRVAVKVIAEKVLGEDPDVLARFQREARAAGAVESQHVVHVLDSGVDAATGRPYLVMECLEGADLADTIDRLGPLPPDLALRIVAQACLGLSRAHEAGIVHRDIKSANVFLARRDEGEIVVKLLDFGIAKVRPDAFAMPQTDALTHSGSLLGSPYYMSPEQSQGKKGIDHRTDIWSLGIVLFEALSGATPFAQCETIGALIVALYAAKPRPVREMAPWVPAPVAAVVHRALSPEPEARFQSAAEMLAALRALLPAGQALHESQIVGVRPEKREGDTLRLSATPPAEPVAPDTLPLLEPAASKAAFATAGGVEKLPRAQTQGRSVWPVAAAGLALAVAGAVGIRGVMHRASEPGAQGVQIVTSSMTPSMTPPIIPSAAPQEPAQPAASAEMDGGDGAAPPPAARAPATKAPMAPPTASAAHGRPPAPSASAAKAPAVYDNMY